MPLQHEKAKDVHIPVPRACEYVTFHEEREFVDVYLGSSDRGIILDYLCESSVITGSF